MVIGTETQHNCAFHSFIGPLISCKRIRSCQIGCITPTTCVSCTKYVRDLSGDPVKSQHPYHISACNVIGLGREFFLRNVPQLWHNVVNGTRVIVTRAVCMYRLSIQLCWASSPTPMKSSACKDRLLAFMAREL